MRKFNISTGLIFVTIVLFLTACRNTGGTLVELRQSGGLVGLDETLTIRVDGNATVVCSDGRTMTFRVDTKTLSDIETLTRQDFGEYAVASGADVMRYDLRVRGKRQVTTNPGHPLIEALSPMMNCGV